MHLFLAGGQGGWSEVWREVMDDAELVALPFGVMVSYVYWHPKDEDRMVWARENNRPTFLDSGAFSALSLGVDVNLDEYIAFAQDRKHLFDHVASLDVVFDAEASRVNHERMVEAGFTNAVPCFHTNEPWEYLDAMQGEEMIGLGVGGQQSRRKPVVQWLTDVFHHMSQWDRQPKVHGYAITSPDWMWRFPWYSVDSSSWFMAARYCRMFWRKGMGLTAHGRGDPPRNDLMRYREFRKTIPPTKAKRLDYYPLLRHNIKQFARLAGDITKAREG